MHTVEIGGARAGRRRPSPARSGPGSSPPPRDGRAGPAGRRTADRRAQPHRPPPRRSAAPRRGSGGAGRVRRPATSGDRAPSPRSSNRRRRARRPVGRELGAPASRVRPVPPPWSGRGRRAGPPARLGRDRSARRSSTVAWMRGVERSAVGADRRRCRRHRRGTAFSHRGRHLGVTGTVVPRHVGAGPPVPHARRRPRSTAGTAGPGTSGPTGGGPACRAGCRGQGRRRPGGGPRWPSPGRGRCAPGSGAGCARPGPVPGLRGSASEVTDRRWETELPGR